MAPYQLISGTVWVLCGLVICYLGYLIAIRKRVELHAGYDGSADADYVARRAGGTALLMGLLVVGYGVRELWYGFDPLALGVLLVALLALSYASKRFAAGAGQRP